jgi:CheY-like chemotaxis protein
MSPNITRGKVLIVDDDRDMVATLSDVLQMAGWKTQGVFTGGEALAALRWSDADCVLMDLKMPGMDGLAALKAIIAEKPDARVVVMTALAGAEPRQEARRAGARFVLSKPVEPRRLIQVLDEVCAAGPAAPPNPEPA